jgi:hypothetical protein
MRCLPVSLLVAMALMLIGSANAQEANSNSASPTQHQSSSLVTRPASVNQSGKISDQKGKPLNASQLDSIANSISGKPPQKPKEPSIIPNGIPEDLLPKWEPKPVEPLDEFKISPLNEGLKVPIR